MIDYTYQVLGYNRLLEILAGYAASPLGQSNCHSLRPSNELEFIDSELRLVSEMRLLLKVKGFVSLSDLIDIAPILRKSKAKGSFLGPEELLSILCLAKTSSKSKKFIRSNSSLCPRIYAIFRDMPVPEVLIKRFNLSLSSNGLVKDSASPALKKIREKKIRLRSDLQKHLETLPDSGHPPGDAQVNLVTVRDGRYVIALRVEKKSRIKGIIHDYSQTRATCFLEPLEVIPQNNRMAELAQDEKEEERRILISLTGMVSELAEDLEYIQNLAGRLDGIYARAKFSEALLCVMPELGEMHDVKLKAARNPILMSMALDKKSKGEDVELPVPVDILLDDKKNVLIISGPNRGGKTVTLKTLGIMSLMTQSGIHIPAKEGSRLPVFNQIIADIGDDQDLQTGDSTFSAHALHLKYLIENMDQNSLVIIDEPGIGTDPDEGVALAMAVLDFLSRQGTFVAVSTHLNRLKTYGLLNRRVQNASVEFDMKKHCPTFRLTYGYPGISHAFDIARQMGVPDNILDRAEKFLDQDEIKLNRLIDRLNRMMIETGREKKQVEDARMKHNSAVSEIKEKLAILEVDKRALMKAKKIDAEEVIKKAGEELSQAITLLKKKKESAQAHVTEKYAEVSRDLLDHFEKETYDKRVISPNKIEKGMRVYHKKLNQEGEVHSVDHSTGRALVMLGKVRVDVDAQDLEAMKKEIKSGRGREEMSVSWRFDGLSPKEVNVIGYRVDDAIPLIDRTIDRALVDGKLTLRVVHGYGTGRLRRAIRAHLKMLPCVKGLNRADSKFGGDAITVVELS